MIHVCLIVVALRPYDSGTPPGKIICRETLNHCKFKVTFSEKERGGGESSKFLYRKVPKALVHACNNMKILLILKEASFKMDFY